MFYIYILYSASSDKYYVGQTDNLERRLIEHNELSEGSYASKHRPWEIKASFEIGSERSLALKVERFIKKQKSRIFIEKVIESGDIGFIIERFN